MKIKITYQPEEQAAASADVGILRRRYSAATVHAGGPGKIYLKVRGDDARRLTPCDFCAYGPPASVGKKPCVLCPAEACMTGKTTL